MGNGPRLDADRIVRAALDLGEDDRAKYLETACGGDSRLRDEVEIRLSAVPDDMRDSPTADLNPRGAADRGSAGTAPAVGRRFGDFEILREIGRGGMGIVFEARQVSLNRKVALKVLPPGMGLTGAAISRFHREAQAAAKLHHTNIVAVYAEGDVEGTCFFAMELVRGKGLDQIIGESRRPPSMLPPSEQPADSSGEGVLSLLVRDAVEAMPPGRKSGVAPSGEGGRLHFDAIARWIADVGEALEHAHRQGVIHRDVKPSNLMLADDGRIKLMDFGLARILDEPGMTMSGEFLGTPLYMSPEQVAAGRMPIDHRTDVYSLGMTLYELLTLRPAFQGSRRDEVLSRILTKEPERPRRIYRRIPIDLETICLKAVEKDPDLRYQSAGDFSEDLRRYLGRHAVAARRSGPVRRSIKWLRRHRLAASAAAVFLILASTAGFLLVKYRQAQEEARAREATRLLVERKAEVERTLWAVQKLHAEGRYAEALEKLESLRPEDHGGLETAILRGRLLTALNRCDEAIAELEALPGEGVDQGAVHYLLALLYRDRDPVKAAEHGSIAEKLLPRTADACHLRALSASTLSEALSWLAQGAELDPGHYPTYKTLALTHYARKAYAEMESAASSMILLRRDDPLGYRLRAIARRELGRLDDALRDHDRALALPSEGADRAGMLRERMETSFRKGSFEEAVGDAERSAGLEPASLPARFQVFACLTALGRIDEARGEYEHVASLGTKAKRQFHTLASLHVFRHLGAGRRLDLPLGERRSAAFHVMLEAAEYFHELDSRADRVVAEGFTATWSPDGKELAYGRGVPGSSGIEILNLETSATRLLTLPGKDPAWSPDGTRIAFVRERPRLDVADLLGDPADRLESLLDQEVWTIAPDGTGLARVGAGSFPSWGSDSKRLYFVSSELGGLCVTSTDAPEEGPELVLAGGGFPRPSPDGTLVASGTDDALEVREIPSGRHVAKWTRPGPAGGVLANWSPDGRKISVGSFGYDRTGLWVYDLATQEARRVLPGSTTMGVWSPDGNRLAFDVRSPHYEIWIAELGPGGAQLGGSSGLTEREHVADLVEAWSRAIEADPDCPCFPAGAQRSPQTAYAERGALYEHLGQIHEAFLDWRRALDQSQEDHGLCEKVAWLELAGPPPYRNPESGIRRVERTLASCRQHDHGGVVGSAWYRAGSLEEALDLLSGTSEDPPVLLFRALALIDLGDPLEAAWTYRHAVELLAAGGRSRPYLSEAVAEIQREVEARLGEAPEPGTTWADRVSTCAAIDRAIARPTPLISARAAWRYLPGRAEPSEGLLWTEPGFDDGGWSEGPSGFGYGSGEHATRLDGMRGSYTTLYLRRAFEVAHSGSYSSLTLSVLIDDGLVAYLNGHEVGRVRARKAGERLPFDAAGSEVVSTATAESLAIDPALLEEGPNVLAIQAVNDTIASPDLTVVPELLAVSAPGSETLERRLAELEASLRERGEERLIAYTEGRRLQLSGRHDEASLRFERAIEGAGGDTYPSLRLAECQRALREPQAALETLRTAIGLSRLPVRRLLGLWLDISLGDLGRSWDEVYADLPEGGVRPRIGEVADLLVVLREIGERRVLRINAGGDGHRSADGTFWIEDRFFLSGRTYAFPTSVTEMPDAPLWASERFFFPPGAAPQRYRIPVSPGSYDVTLSFCEFNRLYGTPGTRVFDVRIEDELVLRDFDFVAEVGFGAVCRRTFPIVVKDDHLDIEFLHGPAGSPKISTIGVQPASRVEEAGR